MQTLFTDFHFLRPHWLFALVPLFAVWWLIWRAKAKSTRWQEIIPEPLLQYLIEGKSQTASQWQFAGLAIAWLLSALALAGPTWQQLPMPIHRSESAVVIILDLSPSMQAEDIKPSRLVRARYKITDYLNQRAEGTSALIVYAGEAHVVSPLTDDMDTINNLLPALEPALMPLAGSNVEMAINTAIDLFKDSNLTQGDIVLFTDGIAPDALPVIKSSLNNTAFRLSIVGVGTEAGAPIPSGNGGFSKNATGNIVVAKLNSSELRYLSMESGGVYTTLQSDNNDISQINSFIEQHDLAEEQRKIIERDFDTWKDQGHWLAILLIPFAALAFRRGWLLTICCAVILYPEPSHAVGWQDLWLTPDQQAQRDFDNGSPDKAAEEFSSPEWKGSAHYRNGDYAAAEQAFARGNSASDHYNRGNALLQLGKADDAITAYEKSLELNPELEDAKTNLAIAKQVREQQKQQEGKDSQENSQGDKQQKSDKSQQGDSQDQSEHQASQEGSEGEQSDSSQSAQNQQQQDNANKANADKNQNESASDEESAQQLAQENSTQEELSKEQLEKIAEQRVEEQRNEEKNAAAQSKDDQQNESSEQMLSQTAGEQGDENKQTQMSQLSLQQQAENAEQQQALDQWLRQVPDDPSGLLKRKFEYQHRQLRQQYRAGEWVPPDNGAYDRW